MKRNIRWKKIEKKKKKEIDGGIYPTITYMLNELSLFFEQKI